MAPFAVELSADVSQERAFGNAQGAAWRIGTWLDPGSAISGRASIFTFGYPTPR